MTSDTETSRAESSTPMELHFTRTNGPADSAIDELMTLVGGIQNDEIVREMILSALKAGQENEDRYDLKIMNSTLKEMRFTAKIFGRYRHRRKVSVFGSARSTSSEESYRMATEMGRRLVEAGFMVITGGGPGIMQAVNEGAGAEHSFGINIRLPFEQKPNPVMEGNPRSINYKYFFNRKLAFLKEADAVVLFPGGFGTLDEAMELLTLTQTGKRDPMPILMVEPPGGLYWHDWLAFVRKQLLIPGFIGADDLNLFRFVQSVEEAVELIRRFYRRYHSLRYVRDTLVVRLRSCLSEAALERIQTAFTDLLRPGGTIRMSGPLPEEEDEPERLHLPRLLVDFDRNHFARLMALIDAINSDEGFAP
ncbi:MAG: TIGR00730 family Rossman fold protein [Desulfobacterales bacterium]